MTASPRPAGAKLSSRLGRGATVALGSSLIALGCSGCLVSSPSTISSTAYFNDVGNLVAGAPVDMAGISIGSVQSISLVGSRAKVVMSIARSARVPNDVSARAEQSTVLGEEVVELVAPKAPSSGALGPGTSRLLANNSVITSTSLVPGIEQFVSGGTAVLGSIGTSQLASLVNAGGQGFGGQALELRRLIANLNTVMAGYASRDGQIRALVASMSRLSASLAPHASANAQAISNLAKTVAVLDAQSHNFLHLLRGLDNLSVEGRSLLTRQLDAIDFQFTGLAGVTGTLDQQQAAVAELLREIPKHDMVMHDVTVNRFSQIIDSLIVCGLPDGGATSQAASSCHGAGSTGKSLLP
ncbi:MAG: MCE family protein [Acidimicrobiales bacterium]